VEGTEEVYQVHSAVAVRWAAPEVLGEKAATAASDVYSLAVTMWECFSRGEAPFADQQTHSGVGIAVAQGKRPPRPAAVTNDAVWDLIQAAWAGEPAARPSAGEVAERLEAILESHQETTAVADTGGGKDHYTGIADATKSTPAHYTGIVTDDEIIPGHYTGIAEANSAPPHYSGIGDDANVVPAHYSGITDDAEAVPAHYGSIADGDAPVPAHYSGIADDASSSDSPLSSSDE
jgi:serine/threonine protein kinase